MKKYNTKSGFNSKRNEDPSVIELKNSRLRSAIHEERQQLEPVVRGTETKFDSKVRPSTVVFRGKTDASTKRPNFEEELVPQTHEYKGRFIIRELAALEKAEINNNKFLPTVVMIRTLIIVGVMFIDYKNIDKYTVSDYIVMV